MEKAIEQTLSKPTLQFGLRPLDYLVLILIATIGNFFIPKLWLLLILITLIVICRIVNTSKRRYFWSSIYLWLITNKNLHLKQTHKLPPILKG